MYFDGIALTSVLYDVHLCLSLSTGKLLCIVHREAAVETTTEDAGELAAEQAVVDMSMASSVDMSITRFSLAYFFAFCSYLLSTPFLGSTP